MDSDLLQMLLAEFKDIKSSLATISAQLDIFNKVQTNFEYRIKTIEELELGEKYSELNNRVLLIENQIKDIKNIEENGIPWRKLISKYSWVKNVLIAAFTAYYLISLLPTSFTTGVLAVLGIGK